MSTIVKFELMGKSNSEEKIKEFFQQILPDTRKYEGCLGAQLSQFFEDKNSILLIENWESQSHFQNYLNWRKETGDFDTLTTMLAEAPSIKIFESLNA